MKSTNKHNNADYFFVEKATKLLRNFFDNQSPILITSAISSQLSN